MSELIPVGNTEADSADIVLAAGETATIFLKDEVGPDVKFGSLAQIQAKADGQYFTIGELNSSEPAKVLAAEGTFRVHRPAGHIAFGVERG